MCYKFILRNEGTGLQNVNLRQDMQKITDGQNQEHWVARVIHKGKFIRKLKYIWQIRRVERYQLFSEHYAGQIMEGHSNSKRRNSWLKYPREWYGSTTNRMFLSFENTHRFDNSQHPNRKRASTEKTHYRTYPSVYYIQFSTYNGNRMTKIINKR